MTDFTSRLIRLGLQRGKAWIFAVLAVFMLSGANAADEQHAPIAIRPDSPASYTVKQGDTLWDIAGRFLEQPWLWPQVWQVNPQIENPDLIYPGDIISLSYAGGQPVLSLNRRVETGVTSGATLPASVGDIRTERRSPEVRRESLLSPIPAIPLGRINALLSKNTVVVAEDFADAPYLLGEHEGRTLFSKGDEVFARGSWATGIAAYDIVRKGRTLNDPETKKVIGVEVLMIGTATITGYNDDRAILRVDSGELEGRVGDRFMPHQGVALEASYLPQPPNFQVDAAIVSIGTGRLIGGQYDTLVLNRGGVEGLAVGQLLAVQQPATVLHDEVGKIGVWQKMRGAVGKSGGKNVEFPGKKVASVLIYRVYDHASLGFVLSSTEPVTTGDRAVTP